jgi:protein disulfide-isomerase
MKRNVWADPEVESVVNAGFTPVMIDVDDPKQAETLSRYGVVGPPTTIITDPKGTVLRQAQGGLGKAEFLELLGKRNPAGNPAPIPAAK